MTVSLLDHLQDQGYEPREDVPGDWFDLTASGVGTVRVCIYSRDGWRVEVHFLDRYQAAEWDIKLSPGTPEAVIIRAVEAAEWQLAGRRGGPVTPAQEATAR